MGWIGDAATLRRVLEWIVGDDAYALCKDGRRVHLVTALGAQSFGLGVTVIGCGGPES